MTFPVPTSATLFDLEAKIDGRRIRANARSQEHARSDYEGAIDDGKFAVLHEELLRGLHMLSVGHLRPGGEVELTTRWATTLSMIGMGLPAHSANSGRYLWSFGPSGC